MRFKKQISNQVLSKYSSDLQPIIEKITHDLGFRLLEVSFTNEHQTNYLRLTISHPIHPISLSACELVSKEVEKELDLKNLIPFSYILEVQSPGINDKRDIASNVSDSDKEKQYEFVLDNLGLIVKS